METDLVLRDATDEFIRGQIKDLEDNYCALYVPQRGKKARQSLHTPENKAVLCSRELLREVAAVEAMQVTPPGEEPLLLLEIIGIVDRLDHRWNEIKGAVLLLTNPQAKIAQLAQTSIEETGGLAALAESLEMDIPLLERWLGELDCLNGTPGN